MFWRKITCSTAHIKRKKPLRRPVSAPAPGLEGVAGPLVEVALHHDAVGRLRVKVHDGVVVGHVLWPQDTS